MDYPWGMARLGSMRWWSRAAADVPREAVDRPILEEELDRPEALRVGVHDASRVEWIVTLPLDTRKYSFEIEFFVEIPANLISPHDVWTHFQELARLHSPSVDPGGWNSASGNDDLRRATLAVIHKLKILQERHGRACTVANSLLLQEAKRDMKADLEPLIEEALVLIRNARDRLANLAATAGASIAESRLADEFLSTKLLDFLSELERDVDGTLVCEGARFREQYVPQAEGLRKRIAGELAAELRRRSEKGFLNPSGDKSGELEDYLERASHLKKHFQEVLFLEMSTKTVEGKLRNVVAVVAAAIASVFYFLAMTGPATMQATGISLGTTALIGAFVYALKDRIKEMARGWLSHRILHLYGERTVALRIPARLVKGRPELVSSRDVFTVNYETRHDSLNPEIGATRRLAVLHYKKRGEVTQSVSTARELERKGLRSVKQIFRFDISAVFPRLDDPVKRIPVLDGKGDSVKWVDAPRTYHFPVTARLVTPAGTVTQNGEIVAQKSGIMRFDVEDRSAEPAPGTR